MRTTYPGMWATAAAAGSVEAYMPLCLHYAREDDTGWTLEVHEHPVCRIACTCTGALPTTDEIVAVLGPLSAPAWLVPVIAVFLRIGLAQPQAVDGDVQGREG